MFGKNDYGAVRVYEYGGVGGPTRGLDQAIEQMFRRTQLWNQFVEIERETRKKLELSLSDAEEQAGIEELKARLFGLRAQIEERRRAERKKVVAADDLRKKIQEAKASLALLIAQAKAARRQRAADRKAALAVLETERKERAKRAESQSELYWGNYDDVRRSYEVARRRALKEGRALRMHRWDGSGKVTVRFQNGLRVPEVFGTDGRLQIDPVPEKAWSSPVRAVRRSLSRTRVRLRIGPLTRVARTSCGPSSPDAERWIDSIRIGHSGAARISLAVPADNDGGDRAPCPDFN